MSYLEDSINNFGMKFILRNHTFDDQKEVAVFLPKDDPTVPAEAEPDI